MERYAIALVLVAAVLHATWNAFVKAGTDRLVTLALVNATRFVLCLAVAPLISVPAPASWPFLLLSAALHVGYYLFLSEAYRLGHLSQVYPLARGLSPLLIMLGAYAFAGETLAAQQLLGVAIVSVAIAGLTFESDRSLLPSRRSLKYAVLTAVFIAAYSVTDGMGVRRSQAPIGYVVWLSLLDGWPLLAIAAARRRRQLASSLSRALRNASAGGLLQLLAYGLVLWAMSFSAMAGVSAVRETSVIFAALIGAVVLREPSGRLRVTAAVLVTAGVLLIQLSP